MCVLRRMDKTLEVYCRRMERLITKTVRDMSRGRWGKLQAYRHLMFMGHLARMPVPERMSARALHWRSQAWWEYYRRLLLPKQRGQRGRRRPWISTPGRTERAAADAFAAAMAEASGDRFWAQVVNASGVWPGNWMDVARERELWRHFCRWRFVGVPLGSAQPAQGKLVAALEGGAHRRPVQNVARNTVGRGPSLGYGQSAKRSASPLCRVAARPQSCFLQQYLPQLVAAPELGGLFAEAREL